MIVLEITKRSDDTKQEFQFEESLSEVTLKRFVDFKETVEANKPKSLSDYEECAADKREAMVATIELKEFDKWQDYFVEFAKYWAKIPDEFAVELREEEITFLYSHINKALVQFYFDENKKSFKHNGIEYQYPEAPLNPFYNKKEYMKGNRLIDTITAMQFDMFATQLGKSQWNVLPKIIAIICKKKGEEMPLNSVSREKWIAERSKLFDSLPLTEALNVAFFLSSRKRIYQNALNRFSNLQYQDQLTKALLKFGSDTAGKPFMSRLPKQESLTARA